MKPDSQVKVKVEADTKGFESAMADIQKNTVAFGKVFTGTIRQAAISGKSFEDTLRSLGNRLASLALSQAFKPLENIFSGFVSNLFKGAIPNAKGNAFGQNGIVPFAKGGVVANPSFFQFNGGLGLMGEAGSEAIMPLARGADGRLGVASQGSNGGGVSVVFNVQATDANSFQKSEGQMTAMLARAVARGQRGL